jgi:hypothetical protein
MFSGFELTVWNWSHAGMKCCSFGMQLMNGLSSRVGFEREILSTLGMKIRALFLLPLKVCSLIGSQ